MKVKYQDELSIAEATDIDAKRAVAMNGTFDTEITGLLSNFTAPDGRWPGPSRDFWIDILERHLEKALQTQNGDFFHALAHQLSNPHAGSKPIHPAHFYALYIWPMDERNRPIPKAMTKSALRTKLEEEHNIKISTKKAEKIGEDCGFVFKSGE